MATQIWTLQLEDGSHTIWQDHDRLTGKRTIKVDGFALQLPRKEAYSASKSRNVPRFQLGGHECALPFRGKGLTLLSELLVDGQPVGMGTRVAPPIPMPRWAWFFIIACAIIPMSAGGGAIPALFGGIGASISASVARNQTTALFLRVAVCVSAVVVSWWVFIAALISMHPLR